MAEYFELVNRDKYGTPTVDISVLHRRTKNIVSITVGDAERAFEFEADATDIELIIEALKRAKEQLV